MELWLLEAAVRAKIEQAQKAGLMPTAEQQLELEARHGVDGPSSSRIMAIAGDTAEISISGVLTKAPSFMAQLFGGGNVTYAEIISALAEADANKDIKQIVLAIDSPGGSIDGLFDALAAIEATKTPTRAVVSNMAASAAFAIAAQTDEIVATNRAASFGSIGIVATIFTSDDEVTITSTEAPKKRPDPTTEEGQAVIRETLDDVHEVFVDAIASGRGTTAEKVNANFGQGATLLADKALKQGMIDRVADNALKIVPTKGKTKTNAETGPMDLSTLKAEHPAVYAEAMQIGADAALVTERDRVTAHLVAGEGSGDMKTALAAITEGKEMTSALQTTYMMAAANRSDRQNRQDDDDNAGGGDNAAADDEAREIAAGAALLNSAAELCGVELEA